MLALFSLRRYRLDPASTLVDAVAKLSQLTRLSGLCAFRVSVPLSSVATLPRSLSQHADVAVNKILIGNKCDMDEDREVRRDVRRDVICLCVCGFTHVA